MMIQQINGAFLTPVSTSQDLGEDNDSIMLSFSEVNTDMKPSSDF